MKIVIAEPVVDRLNELIVDSKVNWSVFDAGPKDKQDLISRLQGAEAASSYSIKYDAEIFGACPDLKYLAIPAVGAEFFVDMEDAKQYGVTVMNCPGYNAIAVAEHAIGLMISVYRQIKEQQVLLQSGQWKESRGRTINGKKVCIVGNGNVGKYLQKLLDPWSVEIDIVDSKSTESFIDTAVSTCDILTLCCPLNDKTNGMISDSRISSMKNDAVIINVGRGAVVDEDAMHEALIGGRLYGAGLDVLRSEPEYGADMPFSIKRFVGLDNVVVTAHVAGSSVESGKNLGQMIYDNLLSCESGSPINVYS